MPVRDFHRRTAVVTGAASGIGKAIADELLNRGAAVAFVDCNPEVKAIASAHRKEGKTATGHVCDVADPEALEKLANEMEGLYGRVQILVNNAGVSVAGGVGEIPLEDIHHAMNVNFWGVVHGCRTFLPRMLGNEDGHILNVCSSFAWLGIAHKSAYSASKAAVRAYTEALRAETLGSTVGVTLFFPGPVDTGLIRNGRALHPRQQEAEAAFLAKRAVPVQRVARRAVHALRQNKPRVVISSDYRLIDLAVRLAPNTAQRLAARVARQLPF